MEFREKEYPTHFSKDVVDVLTAMSFTNGRGVRLHGSSMIRSQQYSGDYDGVERVPIRSLREGARRFKDVIKRLRAMANVRIGDIKCGEIAEWDVMRGAKVVDGKIVGFDLVRAEAVLERLKRKDTLRIETPMDLLTAKKNYRDHIVRWTPGEILDGRKRLWDGRTVSLEEMMPTGMTKVDVIAIVNGRATEFSLIYEFERKGKVLNPIPSDVVNALREDILYYASSNPFKALKRRFALAKIEGDERVGKALTPLLNSDLGRLYKLIGRLSALEELVGGPNPPTAEIVRETDLLREDLGSIFALSDILKEDSELIGRVKSILKRPTKSKFEAMKHHLQTVLNHHTRLAF